MEPIEGGKFACNICKKSFKYKKSIKKHTRVIHGIELKSSGHLLCPVNNCSETFACYSYLRRHLSTSHRKKIETEEHIFQSKSDFMRWKESTQKTDKSFYVLTSSKNLVDGSKKTYYTCHRSGVKYTKLPRTRAARFQVCTKIGSHCPSTIDVREKVNELHVIFCKTHVGHDMELKDLTLSNLEQSALAKCPSGDILFNDLLQGVRENLTSETVVPMALKKRDIRILNKAFETNDYKSGLSDSESVHQWVRLCLQEEDSPVLFFKQEELPDGRDEFLLIIMTEFQKQLLMSSEKSVICVDCVHRRKGRRLYLTSIYIMDECDAAYPVAFCISDKVDASVIKQFLASVKKSTGPLSYTYFMSDSESFYFDVWKEVMDDTSEWLWSMWYVDYELDRMQNIFKEEKDKRAEIYKVMRTLIECHSQDIFEKMFKKYLDSLLVDKLMAARKFGGLVSEKYAPNAKLWAYCYRTGMKIGANYQLEVLHRTLRFCCKEGSKTRLDKFIFVLMKYLKMKMLDRLKNILDDEKIEMVLKTIDVCHQAGLEISPMHISAISDKVWLIKSEDKDDNVFVVRDFDSCPEYCKLRCDECDICIHMYSCSCIPSMINANLCQHIHAVVWKLLIPHHFSPVPSPALDDNAESDSNDTSTPQNMSSVRLGNVLKVSRDIYKSIVKNKSNLNDEALNLIMQKLNEVKVCVDVYSKKQPTLNPQANIQKTLCLPNSNLPPNTPIAPKLVFQAIQQPDLRAGLSQTLVPSQPQLVFPQNKSIQQPYVIYVPNNKVVVMENNKIHGSAL